MRQPLKSFITFSSTEKMGLLALSGILMILLVIRATMYFYIKPNLDEVQQAHLQQAWQQFQQTHKDTASATPDYADKSVDGAVPMPAMIDINTADSETLVRLRGIGPVTAHKILVYRSQKHFTSFDELRKLCRLSATNVTLLRPHIRIQ